MYIRQFYNENQFLIYDERKLVFQSYDSVVAEIDRKTGELFFGSDWDYSNTTRKHLYKFLNDYKYAISADLYAMIFRRGFEDCKNKKQFLQNLIDQKIIKIKKIKEF